MGHLMRKAFPIFVLALLGIGFGQADQTPVQGGTLVVVTGHEPQTLDHHLATGVYDAYMTYMVAEGLVTLNKDGTISPALAISWTQPDPQTYDFELRQGVTFHDGTPFNAEAVKYNFDRLFDEATQSPRASSRLGMVESVEVVDEYHVRIRTKYPFAPFLANLGAHGITAIESPAAMEAAGLADYGTQPVGTGPFRLVEWVQGSHLIFEANDDYWDGRPYLDRVEFRIVRDPSTRAVLLRTGEAHFAVEVAPTEFESLDAEPNITAEVVPLENSIFFEMSNIQEPFDDPRVRQAACYAIDAPAIVQSVLLGYGEANPGVLAASSWAHDASIEGYPYDPERARQLLAEAGYPDGFTTVFWHSTGRFPGDVQVAQAIQAFLMQVGIRAELRTGDLTAWAGAMRGEAPDRPGAPMYLRSWGITGDPESQITVLYHSKNWGLSGNYARYRNERVDELLDMADESLDQAQRAELYKEAERIITEEAPLCKLYDFVRLVAYTDDLHGVIYGTSEYQFFHKAWLDD